MAAVRNPNHPKALSIKELVPGRKLIRFHVHYGPWLFTVAGEPYVSGGMWRVAVTDADGICHLYTLGDLGVLPWSSGVWNEDAYTVDAADAGSLPDTVPMSEQRYRSRSFITSPDSAYEELPALEPRFKSGWDM